MTTLPDAPSDVNRQNLSASADSSRHVNSRRELYSAEHGPLVNLDGTTVDPAAPQIPAPVALGTYPDLGGHDRDAIEKFIRTLCADAPGLIQTVRADGKDLYPRFHTTDEYGIDEAVKRLDNLSLACAENSHLYIQISTCVKNPNTKDQPDFGIFGRKRGGKDNVSHLLCLWNDIDYGADGHAEAKNGRLPNPPDAATAHQIYVRSGLPEASVIINSGGGLYELVLLDEPFDMTSPEGRRRAESVAKRWQQRIEKTAHEMGYHYGAGVSNADRILRVPGTVNTKVWNNKRRATAHYGSDARYTFDDLEALINDLHPEPVAPARPDGGRITVERWNGSGSEHLPGTDFNARGDWQRHILDPAGITYAHAAGDVTYWCRPGKSPRDGHSFSLNHKPDLLFTFTDGTTLPQWKYLDKFSAFAHLFEGGDFKKAAATLRAMGYGTAPDAPEPEAAPAEQPTKQPEETTPEPEPQTAEAPPPPPPADPPATDAPEPEPAALPVVDVTNERDGLLNMQSAVINGYFPEVYVRDGRLVHVSEVSGTHTGQDDFATYKAAIVDASYLRNLSGHYLYPTKTNAKGVPVPALPSKTLCDSVLSRTEWPKVNRLRDVVRMPFVRADGTICQTPGYDPDTSMWLACPEDLRTVPENPSEEDVSEARKLIIDTVLRDFPWVSRADKANYIALLFTPMLREVFNGLSAFGIISASAPSSGKTLLSDLINCVHGGRMGDISKNDDELRKKITSIFMEEMVPAYTFDNVGMGHTLASPMLAQLLTQRVWSDRILGGNQNFNRINDKLWMANGNNIQIGGDMASRSVLVRLDPRVERPEERDTTQFAVGNLGVWMQQPENQARMMWALLVLVRSWAVAGMPKGSQEMRNFTPWVQTMGGLLEFHGIEGLRENKDAVTEADEEKNEWALFLQIWHERHGGDWVTAAQLLADYQNTLFETGTGSVDPWQGTFPLGPSNKTITAKGLGKKCQYYRDRPSNGWVLRYEPVKGRAARWRVERMPDADPAPGAPVPEQRTQPRPSQEALAGIPTHAGVVSPQRAFDVRANVTALLRSLNTSINPNRDSDRPPACPPSAPTRHTPSTGSVTGTPGTPSPSPTAPEATDPASPSAPPPRTPTEPANPPPSTASEAWPGAARQP